MHRPFRSFLVAFALLSAFAISEARADMLLLKDGRVLERPKMEVVETGVKVYFENGEILVPAAMVESAVIENAPPYVPQTPEEQAKVDQGLVPFEGKWVKPDKREELLRKRVEERRAELQTIKEHMLWRNKWEAKTKHFEFEYTVPPKIAQYYQDLMEAYYKEFSKTWKISQPKDLGRLKVCFYITREDFHQIGGVGGGVLAYFRFVKPLELNFYYDRLDPRGTEQVMYHEANHYLQKLMNPDFKMPHFPGEALAEYYGASQFDPQTKKLEVGLVLEGRLTEVKMDILKGEVMGLEKMLTTDGMYQHYYWGWSLAHFLMHDKRYGKKFEKFVQTLASGKGVRQVPFQAGLVTVEPKEVWEHFKRTLGLKDEAAVKALEDEWHAYVKDQLQVTSARGLEEAATQAMNLGLDIKAKRLFKEAIDKGSTSALVYHHYADLLDRGSSRAEAVQYHRKALEFGPLEPDLYVSLGEALYAGDDKEEGKRLLSLALELDPDDGWLASRVKMLLSADK